MKISQTRILAGLLSLSTFLPAQQYVFRTYRQADGLKNLAVRSLARDCKGYLWVATENGIFRFLGTGFEHFGLKQGIAELGIQEVVADSGCTVWVSTTQNLYRFDGERFVPAGSSPIRVTETHGMAVEDEHHLWVADNGRLFRLEHGPQGQLISYQAAFPTDGPKPPNMGEVSSVSAIGDGGMGSHIWVGAGNKLYSWEAAKRVGPVSVWGTQNGLPEERWESVIVDRAGTIWAEGQKHIMALPKGATTFVDHSLPISDQGTYFLRSRLIVDPDGRVLAPTDEGVARWEGNHWRIIDRNHGLPRNNQITAMIFDASGDFWMGSYGDGLYNWSGYEQWEGWGDDKGLPSSIIWAIDASQPGRVVAGTDKGPAWVDPISGASGALIKGQKWLPGWIVALGHEGDGRLWAASNSGSVLRMDDRTGQTQQEVKVPASILSGFKDSSGRLFLGTDHGIYVQDAGPGTTAPRHIAEADALMGESTRVNGGCQAPDGANWFLTGNRLLREQDGQWSAPQADGLPGPQSGRLIALSCAPTGDLWVTGQRIGAWRLTPAGNRLTAWRLEPPEELRGVESYAILAGSRGLIWLGTDQGLLAWNGTSWRHLTQESGMLSNDVDQWGFSQAPDGSLWVGTSGGLAHLLHPERVFDPVDLTVSIAGLHRGDDEYKLEPKLNLAWSPLPLRFQMSSPLVRNRSDLIFKYQIEGLQSGWIESQDGVAVLSGLAPGNYNFMAMASNPGLNANSDIVRLRVVIRSPWWRKTWFIVLSAIVLGFLIAILSRLYARNMRAGNRQLEALVRQRTKELEESREQLRIQATFDGLTGMLNRSAILTELTSRMEDARQSGRSMVLAIIDVDNFKQVNDTYGHLTGDAALQRFSAALRIAIRTTDSAGRYGGEEFLIVLNDIPPAVAERRLVHLHAAISNLRVRVGEGEIRVNCSLGGTVFDPRSASADPESLLSAADQALYAAKHAGRNCVVMKDAETVLNSAVYRT